MEFANGTSRPLAIDAEAEGTIGFVPMHFIPRTLRHHVTPLLSLYDRMLSFRCSAHEYWMMATGATDFCLSAQLRPWDHVAGELIFREAGGYAAMLEDGAAYAPEMARGHLLCARGRRQWDRLRKDFAFLYEG
ncbi:Inositol monophosphatase family protein [compost metagenome]